MAMTLPLRLSFPIFKVCADDASKVASLLSDSTGDTSPVHCADGLLASYPSLSARPCKVSYAALDSSLSDDALLSSAAQTLLKNRRFLVLPSDISSSTDCCQVSFAVGTIGGQTFVIAVLLPDKNKKPAAVFCPAAGFIFYLLKRAFSPVVINDIAPHSVNCTAQNAA